jgi:hypothetical protein
MESALWAGKRRKHQPAVISLTSGFAPHSQDESDNEIAFPYPVLLAYPRRMWLLWPFRRIFLSCNVLKSAFRMVGALR